MSSSNFEEQNDDFCQKFEILKSTMIERFPDHPAIVSKYVDEAKHLYFEKYLNSDNVDISTIMRDVLEIGRRLREEIDDET